MKHLPPLLLLAIMTSAALPAADSAAQANARIAAEHERMMQAEKQRRALAELRTQAEISQAQAQAQSQASAAQISRLSQQLADVREDSDGVRTTPQGQSEADRLRENYRQRKASEVTPVQVSYDAAFDASLSRAKQEFAWMKNEQSPQFKRAAQLDAELERLGSPLFLNPEKPYIIAHIVALELARKKTTP